MIVSEEIKTQIGNIIGYQTDLSIIEIKEILESLKVD